MQVLCIAQSHRPHGDFYYICLNLKEMLSAVITASRSGADLVSHWVVPAGIRSALYSERGATQGKLWGHRGASRGNDAQLRLCTARAARASTGISQNQGVTLTTALPLAFGCASLCPCTDWPCGGNVNLLENTCLHLLPAPHPLWFFPCSPFLVKESVLTF